MAFCDFVVKYDPEKDRPIDVTKRILYTLFIKRVKNKKPTVTFIGGDSGEGKSYSNLVLQNILLGIQGIPFKENMNIINVYTPLEYPQKLNKLLFDKEYKKVNIICMHEAREIIKSKQWHSFLNQAVGDINAMSRSVKRLCIFITSQFIRDISTDIRYTLNYYITVKRPLRRKARLYLNVMWKDDRDLEKPKLRKRRISGYLVYPDGRYRRYVPQYLELTKPPKEICEAFETCDREAKVNIIRRKIDKMIKEMEIDLEVGNKKVEAAVDFYASNPESLKLIGKRRGKGWKLLPKVKEMHDLTPSEAKEFESMLNDRLKKVGVIEDDEKKETGKAK